MSPARARARKKVYELNAELTMGENLADLGGLSLAAQALERHVGTVQPHVPAEHGVLGTVGGATTTHLEAQSTASSDSTFSPEVARVHGSTKRTGRTYVDEIATQPKSRVHPRKPLRCPEVARAFFLSWANIWKIKQGKADIIQRLTTDPHAPAPFRANLVNNVELFYKAFGVEPGDPMSARVLFTDKRPLFSLYSVCAALSSKG